MIGTHLLLDIYDAKNLDDKQNIIFKLKQAIAVSGATLLDISHHQFQPYGFSCVALLKESHISIHTWPEKKFVAVDIFTCGSKINPYKTIPIFSELFETENIVIDDKIRGDRVI